MLSSISINNYALIDHLQIDFSSGLSIITGETGAGKSILLGALGLVLGNRADLTALKDNSKKCVVEAKLAIGTYALESFFEEADLDYEQDTIIRREILPSGKSRAFVNDTPVTLLVVNALKAKLMDIHSQHQTSELSDVNFQFTVIDALSKNHTKIESYKRGLLQLNALKKELYLIKETQREANQQYDYNLHLFEELDAAKLIVNEQETLEVSLDKLNNIEAIQLHLSEALSLTISDEIGIQSQLSAVASKLQKVAPFSKEYEAIASRFSSLKIELDDLVGELENANEDLEFNPNEAEKINDRLQLIYNLQKKHYVNSIDELIRIQTTLSEKLLQKENAEEYIAAKHKEIEAISEKLDTSSASYFRSSYENGTKIKKIIRATTLRTWNGKCSFFNSNKPF